MATRKSEEKLTWVNVNVDSLPKAAATAHGNVRKAFDATKSAKAAFETEFTRLYVAKLGALPDGKVLKFSYLRGLAVALATESTSKSEGAISF